MLQNLSLAYNGFLTVRDCPFSSLVVFKPLWPYLLLITFGNRVKTYMYKVRCIDDRWIGLYGYYLGQFFQGHIYMGERGTGIFPKHQFLKFNLFSFFPLHIRQSCWSGLVVPSSSPTSRSPNLFKSYMYATSVVTYVLGFCRNMRMLRRVINCISIFPTFLILWGQEGEEVEEWNVKGGGTVLSFVLCQRLTPFTDDCMLVNTPENSEVNGIYRGRPGGICFGCRHARTLCHPCQGLHYRCHLVLL